MSNIPKPHVERQILIISFSILAFLFGLWFHHNAHADTAKEEEVKTATLFPQPRVITPFLLTDQQGRPFTLESLKGQWNLVFFGFTNCPDLCPTTLATLNQSYQKLAKMKDEMLQVVFISIDPGRDNTQRIASYLKNFNPAFMGATGAQNQLDRLAQEMSVIAAKSLPKDPEHPQDYNVDHSGSVLIVNPRGQLVGVFSPPLEPTAVAHDMSIVMAAHS